MQNLSKNQGFLGNILDEILQSSKKIEDSKLARDFQETLEEFQSVQQLASKCESMCSPSMPPSFLCRVTGIDEHLASIVQQENQPLLMEQKMYSSMMVQNVLEIRIILL